MTSLGIAHVPAHERMLLYRFVDPKVVQSPPY